jgi:hypothetical protein
MPTAVSTSPVATSTGAIIEKRMLPHFGKGQVEDNLEILDLVEAVSDWMVLPELSVPRARMRLEKADSKW